MTSQDPIPSPQGSVEHALEALAAAVASWDAEVAADVPTAATTTPAEIQQHLRARYAFGCPQLQLVGNALRAARFGAEILGRNDDVHELGRRSHRACAGERRAR